MYLCFQSNDEFVVLVREAGVPRSVLVYNGGIPAILFSGSSKRFGQRVRVKDLDAVRCRIHMPRLHSRRRAIRLREKKFRVSLIFRRI